MVWPGLHQVSPKNKHYLSIVGDFISDERQPFPHEVNQCRPLAGSIKRADFLRMHGTTID